MMDDIVVSVRKLSKVYKIFDKPADRVKEAFHPFRKRYSHDFYALKDISLDVKRGENIGFIGKNGAGKSTLLKLITGVLTPTAGCVEINGKIASLLELGAGFNPEMTGIENIYMNGSIMGRSKAEMDDRIDDIILFADIGEFISQPVKMYSSGMFARLAFAVNAFIDPDILIVDEALSVGDNSFQMKCMKKMREMIDGGTAVLFVSHDLNAIRRFCTKAYWLEDGKIKNSGETNKVVDCYVESMKIEEARARDKVKIDYVQSTEFDGSEIAEVQSVKLLDINMCEVVNVPFDLPIKVEIVYNVYNENVENPVIGIALRSIDDEYVCGLNTLLDNVDVPWDLGQNEILLEYSMGLRVLSGHYYIDVALYEETATVPIQYIYKAKEISVSPDYKGEGEFILPHEWKVKKNK